MTQIAPTYTQEEYETRQWHVICNECDVGVIATEKRLRADGWRLDAEGELCPDCATTKGE